MSFIHLVGRLQVALRLSVISHQREEFRIRIRENIDYPLEEISSIDDLRRSKSHKSNLENTYLSKSGT